MQLANDADHTGRNFGQEELRLLKRVIEAGALKSGLFGLSGLSFAVWAMSFTVDCGPWTHLQPCAVRRISN